MTNTTVPRDHRRSPSEPMPPPANGSKAGYHHGDLRHVLIQAGLERLERDGLEALSLRALATQVGVSHAAPAYHFRTVKGLRTALATVGFTLFGDTMRQARHSAGAQADAQLRAVGASYVAFAQTHPVLFNLMFTNVLLDWTDPALQVAGTQAREELRAICQPAAAHLGLTDTAEQEALERLVWAYAHGVAHLRVGGQFGSESGGTPGVLDISTFIFGGPPRLLALED